MLQPITEDVKKQAEQRIRNHSSCTSRRREENCTKRLWKICRIQKIESNRILGFRAESHGTIVGRYLENKQYHVHMHEQRYTQSDMEEYDTTALERKSYEASPKDKRVTTETNAWSHSPLKKDPATP